MPRTRFELAYKPIDELMAKELAEAAHKWDAGWAVVFGDHESFRWHEAAFQAVGWLTFAPVVWVRKDSAPRFFADGPANAAEYILVARPRRLPTVRFSRPGIYESGINRDGLLTGAKPVDLMRAIVRDYSEPGDLIVDPFCGSGTTALAAAMEGRRCITSEEKPEHYAIAKRRLDRGYQPCLLT
jgi:DNA modification methylase